LLVRPRDRGLRLVLTGERARHGGGRRERRHRTFQLAWQDEFDSFDGTRWQLESFTFGGNLARFTPANATFVNGLATLSLTPEPTDAAEPYRGVEMRSVDTITYGKVESRIRFAKGSAVVSSLVLLYTPYPADNWNELDIEFLGRYSDRAQFNEQVYTGPPTTPPVTQSVTPRSPRHSPLSRSIRPLIFTSTGSNGRRPTCASPSTARWHTLGRARSRG